MAPARATTASVLALGLLLLAVVEPARAAEDGPPAFYGADGQFVRMRPPQPVPRAPVVRNGRAVLDLGRLRGEVLLVNVWATWCAPCRWEMPTLDRLQARMGGDGLEVVAVSIDEGGTAAVEPYYADVGIENLDVYVDPEGDLVDALGPTALPQSYVVDRTGRVVGYVKGAADWDSEAARALLRYYIDRGG